MRRGEELRKEDHRSIARDFRSKSLQVLPPAPPESAGQIGAIEQRRRIVADNLSEGTPTFDRVQRVEDLLFSPAEEFRKHFVDHDRGNVDIGFRFEAAEKFDGLGDRHLLRGRDDDGPGDHRIGKEVDHPLRLLADPTDLHEFVHAAGERAVEVWELCTTPDPVCADPDCLEYGEHEDEGARWCWQHSPEAVNP